MPGAASPHDRRPRWELLEQHLDEAAFAWPRWEAALRAPDRTLDEVADGEEERLLAHVDGLVLGGPAVTEALLVPALRGDEPHAAGVAALVLSNDAAGLDLVVEAWGALEAEPARLVARALELSPSPLVAPRLQRVLVEGAPALAQPVLAVLAFRREPASAAERAAVLPLLEDDAPNARALGWRLVEAGRGALDPRRLATALSDVRPVHRAALRVALRAGVPSAWSQCLASASRGGIVGELARVALGAGGSERGVAALRAVTASPDGPRLEALAALRHAGTVGAVEAALALGADEDVGTAARGAVAAVTGAPPRDAASPDLLRAWWSTHKRNFAPNERYVSGQPVDAATVLRKLLAGPMNDRPAWAFEVALRTGGRLSVETSAFTRRQREELAARTALDPIDWRRPLDGKA